MNKYGRAVGWSALTLTLAGLGVWLPTFGITKFDWSIEGWGFLFVVLGALSLIVGYFSLTIARAECKVVLMKTARYKNKSSTKKLKEERRSLALKMLQDKDGPEYYMRKVLLVEKKIAEIEGKSWDPPEHYRDEIGL